MGRNKQLSKIIEHLKSSNESLNTQDEKGLTRLHYACESENIKAIELLIKNGASISIEDDNGKTPMDILLSKNNVELLSKVIELILQEYVTNQDIQTVLKKLSQAKNSQQIRRVLSANPNMELPKDVLMTMVECAIAKKDIKLMEMLIKNSADINEKICIKTCQGNDGTYTTVLCKAVASASVEMVKLLLDNGADVNASNAKGYIPLHIACISGNKKIIRLLVEYGSNVNAYNDKGFTPLYYAYENRSIHQIFNKLDISLGSIEKYLKSHGATLGLNESNYQKIFRNAMYSYNLYILRDMSSFKINNKMPDVSLVAKLIFSYYKYQKKNDIALLKDAVNDIPKERKMIIYQRFFQEIGEDFKAEFNKKDGVYKELTKVDDVFFNVLNTVNQLLNREDNVGNSMDKLDLLTAGFNNMVSKYCESDFSREFVKSSNASLLDVMHNIKDESVITNIVKLLNNIRYDNQMFLLTNTRAGNIHNIPEAVFKIKSGPLKGKYVLLLVNFGYGYDLKHLGASTVSSYVFSMDDNDKVYEIARRIFKIANNFEDSSKSEHKIGEFYGKIRELFFEEHKKLVKEAYDVHLFEPIASSLWAKDVIDKDINMRLGITVNFDNNIPRNICNCFVKQQQKMLEVMLSILKTCYDKEKQGQDFDIISVFKERALDVRVCLKYTHLDGLMKIQRDVQEMDDEVKKSHGIKTKEFKKELATEILKVGVHGLKEKNGNLRNISKKEALSIYKDLWTKKEDMGLDR